MANSFEVKEESGKFISTSFNFPDCVGEGETEDEAIKKMSSKIIYIRDNEPNRFNKVVLTNIKKLIADGETPMGVYQGGAGFIRRF